MPRANDRVCGLIRALVAGCLLLCVQACSDSSSNGPGGNLALNHFYVANTDSGSISVIDHATRSVIETIDVDNKPHGHGPSSAGDWLYATMDSGDGEVLGIDTTDQTIDWRLPVGAFLNEPHLTVDNRYLYAPDLVAATTWVIDVLERRVVDEVDMLDEQGNALLALHNTYASHDGKYIYVTAILSQAIARIDVSTNEIDRIYKLPGDPRPAAITKDDRFMYVQLSAFHGFVELDLQSGEVTRAVEWPTPDPLPPEYTDFVESPLETQCHGIKITPDGKELWAATNIEGFVYVYTLPELQQKTRFRVGAHPNWIAFDADGSSGYVTLAAEDAVAVVDGERYEVVDKIPVGRIPKRIHLVEVPVGDD